ncbi:MAG: hypothetical protein CBC38_00950 [Gammaproteobacteria bacterium TMED78]|nr:MAG: hypothetical protein CBC38_00950 [Gammaproteobacteria bacterium TMED78]|tara:strand:+ start:37577 stop:38842 length:1266 start_codon:yes stop_codon:yes gene_type:complete
MRSGIQKKINLFLSFLLPLIFLACSDMQNQTSLERAYDDNGMPLFQVDPFWPKTLPNNWSNQQAISIFVDKDDHIWWMNRDNSARGDEIGAEFDPPRQLCCIRGPAVIEMDQEGNVLRSWGGSDHHPLFPQGGLQTIIVDDEDFVWIAGTSAQSSITKWTKDGEFVWDFGRRPTDPDWEENNQQTDILSNKGRFQLDNDAREIYIIQQKRVLVYDMDSGDYKRGWGGHGMPLSEVSNVPLAPYVFDGINLPPEEVQFAPALHFIEISNDGLVYVGERGQNRMGVYQKDGTWVEDIYVGAEITPGERNRRPWPPEYENSETGIIECGSLRGDTLVPPCGTMYKLALSKDPEQKYAYIGDGTNNVVWIVDRLSGETLGHFGRNGRYAGEFHWLNAIATDSDGNIYTGEVETGKRIQKFLPVLK